MEYDYEVKLQTVVTDILRCSIITILFKPYKGKPIRYHHDYYNNKTKTTKPVDS